MDFGEGSHFDPLQPTFSDNTGGRSTQMFVANRKKIPRRERLAGGFSRGVQALSIRVSNSLQAISLQMLMEKITGNRVSPAVSAEISILQTATVPLKSLILNDDSGLSHYSNKLH